MRTFILALLAASCAPSETGINRTLIEGTVSLAPAQTDEGESTQGANDSYEEDTAVDLGAIGYRYQIVNGSCLEFSAERDGPPTGDFDYYRFSPLADGTMTMSLLWQDVDLSALDTGSAAPGDNIVYQFTVYDLDNMVDDDPEDEIPPAPTVLYDGQTDGSYGDFQTSVDVVSGGNYAVRVAGRRNTEGSGDYTLVLNGFDPNDTRFLVGAYQSDDIWARGNPVGGAEVTGMALPPDRGMGADELSGLSLAEQLTWIGDYKVVYIREVIADEVPADAPDTAEPGLPSYNEGLTSAYLFAGNFPSLNAGLTSGTLFSSTPIQVSFGPDDTVTEGTGIVCDTIQPKIYGWTTTDEEPNNVTLGDSNEIVDGTPQACPVASGAGVVDVITGTLDFEADDPQWAGENDAYTITVDEELGAFITMAWGDTNYNLDLNFYDSTGTLIAAGWNVADTNPEVMSTTDNYGFTLVPGETYTIGVLPWSGPAGAVDYSIEIEWSAP